MYQPTCCWDDVFDIEVLLCLAKRTFARAATPVGARSGLVRHEMGARSLVVEGEMAYFNTLILAMNTFLL